MNGIHKSLLLLSNLLILIVSCSENHSSLVLDKFKYLDIPDSIRLDRTGLIISDDMTGNQLVEYNLLAVTDWLVMKRQGFILLRIDNKFAKLQEDTLASRAMKFWKFYNREYVAALQFPDKWSREG